MIGPPGCGKSMLAERYRSLLPSLAGSEILETVRVHSIAGQPVAALLRGERPFRNPHHAVSDAGLIGGGPLPKPGEISLAHRGVLFLDEFPEYRRSAIEALRAPLETGVVRIARARASVTFPASFQLIAAMNPCPCGRLGVKPAPGEKMCLCSRPAIEGYLRKLSQPILDRIDLHVDLEPVPFSAIARGAAGEAPGREEGWREQVSAARTRQLARSGKLSFQLTSREVARELAIRAEAMRLLERAAGKMNLSVRGYVRVLRVARTIGDLEQADEISSQHIAEALSFRGLERIANYARG